MPAIVLFFVSSCFRGCIGRGRASIQRLVRETSCGAQEHCCDPAARVRHTRASSNKTLLSSAEPGLPPRSETGSPWQLVRSGLARHAECSPRLLGNSQRRQPNRAGGHVVRIEIGCEPARPGPLESSRARLPAGRLSQNRFPARGKLRTTPLSKLLPICCNERWKSGWPTHGAAAALQEIGG